MAIKRTEKDILSLAANLLARAESTDSENERELCMRQYANLMAKHNLDQEAIRAEREGREYKASTPVHEVFEVGSKGNRASGAYAYLLSQICLGFGMRTYLNNKEVDVIGMAADVKAAYDLYLILVGDMVRSAINYLEDRDNYAGVSKLDARKSFYRGYAEATYNRILEEREKAEREAVSERQSTALVVADKKRAINAMFDEEFGRVSWYKPSGSAWSKHSWAGARAARSASHKRSSGEIES